jgi:multidrug transporter EmrE-like cation transporter
MSILLIIPAPVWLFISSIFFAGGEFLSKKWAMHPTSAGLTLTIACYACSSLLWLPALFHKNELAIMGTAWLLLATLATILIGYFVFNESLSTKQMAGLTLSAAALIMLNA